VVVNESMVDDSEIPPPPENATSEMSSMSRRDFPIYDEGRRVSLAATKAKLVNMLATIQTVC